MELSQPQKIVLGVNLLRVMFSDRSIPSTEYFQISVQDAMAFLDRLKRQLAQRTHEIEQQAREDHGEASKLWCHYTKGQCDLLKQFIDEFEAELKRHGLVVRP